MLPSCGEAHQRRWIATLGDGWRQDAKERGVILETYPEVKLSDFESFREKFPGFMYAVRTLAPLHNTNPLATSP